MTTPHRIELTYDERVLGMLQGHLLGDAWGSAYEFGAAIPVTAPLPFTKGIFGHPAGTGTDDTAVMRAVAATLIELEGSFHPAVYARHLVAWADTGPLDIGGQTAKAVRYWRSGSPPPPDSRSQGNGALMGSCPLGVLGPAAAYDAGADLAAATHPSLVTCEAVADYAELLALILQDDAHPDLVDVTELEPLNWEPVGPKIGWVTGCEWLARAALQRALITDTSPVEALGWVIRQGGDTDTNGAVAGALLGAWFGPWPPDFLANLDPAELNTNTQLAAALARVGDRP